MLKLAMIAAFGLSAAALALTEPPSAARLDPCAVTNKGAYIQWSQANPGQSPIVACQAGL
jgi:hypothetical protein